MFGELNRDHGYISAQNFREHFRPMFVEHVKKYLVLGWVHYLRSQKTWYPQLSKVEIPEEPARKIFQLITELRSKAHSQRREVEKKNEDPSHKKEVKILQDFANQWKHMQQHRLRQRHRFNPGTTPIRAWAHRKPVVEQ